VARLIRNPNQATVSYASTLAINGWPVISTSLIRRDENLDVIRVSLRVTHAPESHTSELQCSIAVACCSAVLLRSQHANRLRARKTSLNSLTVKPSVPTQCCRRFEPTHLLLCCAVRYGGTRGTALRVYSAGRRTPWLGYRG